MTRNKTPNPALAPGGWGTIKHEQCSVWQRQATIRAGHQDTIRRTGQSGRAFPQARVAGFWASRMAACCPDARETEPHSAQSLSLARQRELRFSDWLCWEGQRELKATCSHAGAARLARNRHSQCSRCHMRVRHSLFRFLFLFSSYSAPQGNHAQPLADG